jgi:hypothetical protein
VNAGLPYGIYDTLLDEELPGSRPVHHSLSFHDTIAAADKMLLFDGDSNRAWGIRILRGEIGQGKN